MIRDALPDDARGVADIWNHYIRDTLVTFNFAEKSVADVMVPNVGNCTGITRRSITDHDVSVTVPLGVFSVA